jgi:hypothetical protein
VRDSKNIVLPSLDFAAADWQKFVAELKQNHPF